MIVVLDIDGTLANNDHRAHHVDRAEGDARPKDWEGFLAPHLVAKDVLIEGAARAVQHFLDLKYRVLFLTGRNEGLRSVTTQWIKEKLDIDATDDTLTMRPPGNMMTATKYKREQIINIKQEFPKEPLLFIDDDKYMWPVYAEFGIVLRAPECWNVIFPVNAEVEPVDVWRK